MLRTALPLALLVGTCSSEPPPADPTPTAPAADVATPAPEPAATPTPDAEPAGQPWTNRAQAGPNGHVVVDVLTFWGWSADGARYAFETFDHGAGAVECEGAYALRVVDAASDSFVDGGKLDLRYESPEPASGGCVPSDLAGAWGAKRTPFLAQHGIVVGNVGEVATITATGVDGSAKATLADGRELALRLTVLDSDRDAAMTQHPKGGAGFKLTLGERVIEPGTRRRAGIWSYSIAGTPLFVAPGGKNAALTVKTIHIGFEGDRHSFMTNGVTLP